MLYLKNNNFRKKNVDLIYDNNIDYICQEAKLDSYISSYLVKISYKSMFNVHEEREIVRI